ncbi:hypothetical protein FOMPIDRAFT_97591, partial [Fomitopsis schrenkii]
MDVYTSTRPSPPRQITPSESDSASSSPEAHRRTHTQTWFPSPPIELSSSSSAAMQGAPTSGSLNGSHQGGRSGTLSKDRDFKGRASARRALYTSSGFTRVASSRATTSSGSSMSRYPDFNVPPIDLQLPPARAARSSRTPVRSSAPLGVDPASPTSVSSTGVAIQSTVSVAANRRHLVLPRPTYPDAVALNLQGRAPLKKDTTLFDDIATLLRPTPSFHAPALGYYNLAGGTSWKPLALIGSERPFRNAS